MLDQLDASRLAAVVHLLELMVEDDEDELTEEEQAAIQVGLDSLAKQGAVSMEEVLADFGLTQADFEKMAAEPDPVPATKVSG